MMNDVLERIAKLEAAVERIERRLACGEESPPPSADWEATSRAACAGDVEAVERIPGFVREMNRELAELIEDIGEVRRGTDLRGAVGELQREMRREMRELSRLLRSLRGRGAP